MEAPGWYHELMHKCPPTRHTIPDWGCESTRLQFHKYMVCADVLGLTPMPWQKLFLALLSMPRCRTLVLQVGRQQGKTVSEMIPISETLLTRSGSASVYSAQRGIDAQNKVKTEFMPMLKRASLLNDSLGFRMKEAVGDFGVIGMNDTRLRTMSSGENTLRGETRVALGIIDEARADANYNRQRSLYPTMLAVKDSKAILSSTAGDVKSVFWNEQQDKARGSYNNPNSSICLFEYALDDEEEYDPGDEALWRRMLPAIDYTITIESVRVMYESMEPHDFAMEFLGKRLAMATDEAIPPKVWTSIVGDKALTLSGELSLAVDAPPGMPRTALVVADAFGVVELIDVVEGPADVFKEVRSLLQRNPDITKVGLVKNSDTERLGERLENEGLWVEWFDTAAMKYAANKFWEAAHFEPPGLQITPNPVMNESNRGAFRWELAGGGWVFRRQTPEAFASPLIAATLAFDMATTDEISDGSEISDDTMWDSVEDSTIWD